MINPLTNKRELAYIVRVNDTRELLGYEHVHYVNILGWWCVSSKELNIGDLGVYFEIDSILPRDDNRFLFMEKYAYRVRTQKMCRVVSQGIVLPLALFPEIKKPKNGDFLTDKLGVKLFNPNKKFDLETKERSNHIVSLLMKLSFFRWFITLFFEKDKMYWPYWLPKTNCERVQNVPTLFNSETKWIATEKIDGISTSFVLNEKNIFMVCSHNVVVYSSKQTSTPQNVWIEMAEKYSMMDKLQTLKKKYNLKTVAIQGEIYGDRIQKRSYGLKNKKHDLAVFHIWFDGKRLDVKRMIDICDEISIPHVHVFYWGISGCIEDLIMKAEQTQSAIDGGMIEGYILYSQDGSSNYSCVPPAFLLKYK